MTEKLHREGITVLRLGNPARISEEVLMNTLDAKVAWGQSNNPANNCPVWLQSSSTAILSTSYIVFPIKLSRSFILKLCASALEQRLMAVALNHV